MAKTKKSKAPAQPKPMNAMEAKAYVEMKKKEIRQQVSNLRAFLNDNIAPNRSHGAGWDTPNVRERDFTKFNREKTISYARELVDKFPIVAGLVQSGADHIIGSGFVLNMTTDDEKWNKDLEQAWLDIKDTVDIRGIRSWGQLQRMWYVRRFIDGDVAVRRQGSMILPKIAPHDRPLEYYKKRNVPMDIVEGTWLATIEADRIRCNKFDFLDQGVGYSDDGRPLSYFIGPRPEHQLDWEAIMKKGKWVSAQEMKLYANFTGERADQLRGQSVILQSFNVLRQIADVIDAVTDKIQNEAFMAAQFTSDATYTGSMFADQEETKTAEDGISRQHLNVLKGSIITPAAGEKMELLGMKTPNQELLPFLRFLIRYCGSASGFPLELMLLDMSDTNFSGGRMIVELAKKRFRVEQDAMSSLSSWGAMWVLQSQKEFKRLSKTAGRNPWKHRWGRPSLPYYNPQQEALANTTMMDHYLVAPQDIIADLGEHDAEHVLDAHAKWQAQLKARNLPVVRGNLSTTLDSSGSVPAGNKTSASEGDVDASELERGTQMEMEHTDDPEEAKKIATDHLSETPDYYTQLEKIERKSKPKKKDKQEEEK